MLNWIWFGLLGIGIAYASVNGNMAAVTEAALGASNDAVALIFEMCGLLCLWLGILRICEASGLVAKIGRGLAPLIGRLFPQVPPDHPAFTAIVMNFSANLLGLGNAATPFGLKAMAHLQELNNEGDTASAAMITLLVLNTSSITLIPTIIISLRMAAGSVDPTCVIGPTVLASSIGLSFALLLDAALRSRVRGR